MPFQPIHLLAALAASYLPSIAAHAAPASLSIEAVTDERRRGLSWSDGKPSASANANIPLPAGLEASFRLSALRGSERVGGADAGLTTGIRHVTRSGPWTFQAGLVGNLFVDRSRFNHVELQASAAHQLGPAQARIGAAYAPSQRAIGGSNLYLSGDLETSLPGTPYTIYGGVGRSSGETDAPVRARVLRPAGAYWDHRIGIERVDGSLVLGLRYSDTDIDGEAARHSGARLVAYASIGL